MTTPAAVPPLSDFLFALPLALLLLAPLAIAGVALVHTGLGRSRSAAQSLLGSITIVAVAAVAFAVLGVAFACNPSYTFFLAGKPWNWLGSAPLLLHNFNAAQPLSQMSVLFEFMAVAFAAIIPWGSGADRFRLPAGCISTAFLAAAVFPLLAH